MSNMKVEGDNFAISFAFTKVDKINRTVTGVATADNIDSEEDLVDIDASNEAFNAWLGNIREMHQPKAVGTRLSAIPVKVTDKHGQVHDGIEVTAHVSKGAQDTWEKCLDGTLKGFSIGGLILEKSKEFNKTLNRAYTRIKKYILVELSLVDNPANPLALFSMVKSVGGVMEMSDILIENHSVFYCSDNEIAQVDDSVCPICKSEMSEIGFIENTDDFKPESVTKMITEFEGRELMEKTVTTEGLQNNAGSDKVEYMSLTDNESEAQEAHSFKSALKKFLFGAAEEIEKSAPVEGAKEEVVDTKTEEVTPSDDKFDALVELVKGLGESVVELKDTISKDMGREIVGNAGTTHTVGAVTGDTPTGGAGEAGDNSGAGGADFLNPIIDLTKSVETLSGVVEGIAKSVSTLDERLTAIEAGGAMSKAAVVDDNDEVEIVTKSKKEDTGSFWGNAFVDKADIAALGYEE